MSGSRVHTLDPDQLTWRFDTSEASYRLKHEFGYGTHIVVDPFPAYPHDEDETAAALHACEVAFPLPEPFTPHVYLLSHEVKGRTNGQTHIEWDWKDETTEEQGQKRWRGLIVLSAKRIPPHPVMTRYLVAHEYGHVVEDWFIRGRGEGPHSTELLLEYADRRGMDPTGLETAAGGGTWHKAVQEIFACDFRLLRCNIEPEFWPHPGIPRPETLPAIRDWWAEQG